MMVNKKKLHHIGFNWNKYGSYKFNFEQKTTIGLPVNFFQN